MRLARAAALALLAASLAGCVTAPPRVDGGLWTGRMSVRSEGSADQPARSSSGQFELSGSARHGQLVLTSPLGTVVARASWSLRAAAGASSGGDDGDRIELDTGNGPRRYASLDDMMQDALGDALPLEAMFDWLEGRPWPGAASIPLEGDGRSGFTQLGWTVDLARLADARLISADRAAPPPALHVRVKLDAAAGP